MLKFVTHKVDQQVFFIFFYHSLSLLHTKFATPQIWTAQRMIQQVGVTLPEAPPDRQHLLHGAFKKVIMTLLVTTCLHVVESSLIS